MPCNTVQVLMVNGTDIEKAEAVLKAAGIRYEGLPGFFATEQFTELNEAVAWWNE